MNITGIICEYNPLHMGHKKQLVTIRALQGEDGGIVCVMSGNFVQRGAPAILDKMLRAKAAIKCGADLVLELPVTTALNSAEGFAAGGVSILSQFCSHLCFGAETPDSDLFMKTAQALLSDDFRQALRVKLDEGLSFPAARQVALERMGADTRLLETPNNILGVEYCKAILSLHSDMQILPIPRPGSYHDTAPDPENPSATALRLQMLENKHWQDYVPAEARDIFTNQPLHRILAGERAILGKLRCMTDEEFEALPFSSEGLWRKLMHSARESATLEDVINATKSKRYTRTRLDRMVMCAYLGITQKDLDTPAPYIRVLALNEKGRAILKKARQIGEFINIGETRDHPYQALENRCSDLYGLFATEISDPAGKESKYRIFYDSKE